MQIPSRYNVTLSLDLVNLLATISALFSIFSCFCIPFYGIKVHKRRLERERGGGKGRKEREREEGESGNRISFFFNPLYFVSRRFPSFTLFCCLSLLTHANWVQNLFPIFKSHLPIFLTVSLFFVIFCPFSKVTTFSSTETYFTFGEKRE